MTNFTELGIDTSYPGFYNDHNFLKVETSNHTFLAEYNKYVVNRKYGEKYLENSKTKIDIIIDILYEELLADGRLGACIDICQTLLKIFERENIWCCAFSGSVTLRFDKSTLLADKFFYYFDAGNYSSPHQWIYAPPYKIIDISIGLQKYTGNELEFLPKYIAEQDVLTEKISPNDIINPEIIRPGIPLEVVYNKILSERPDVSDFIKAFPAFKIQNEMNSVSYFPLGAGASDGELETMNCISFSGKTPAEVYNEKIIPELTMINN